MILGFFYVREKQLWEDKRAIESLEARGGAAILEMRTELEKLRLRMAAVESSIWELEHRVANDPYGPPVRRRRGRRRRDADPGFYREETGPKSYRETQGENGRNEKTKNEYEQEHYQRA